MIFFIGCVDCPEICLKYYVVGNRKNGYDIQIIDRNGENSKAYASRNLQKALNLARCFRHFSVTPVNLHEIMEDLTFQAMAD